jgi:hypothetical protein
MSISKIRTILYGLAKYLGDLTALKKALKSGSFQPLIKRIFRRLYGRFFSQGFNIFK